MSDRVPYVEYKYFEPKASGGTRGKKEYRRHVQTHSLLGRDGGHVFRGSCPECGWEFIGKRLEKRQNLFNCPECDFTSFVYKGFFSRKGSNQLEVVPPKQDEFSVPLWRAVYKYSSLDPRPYYGSEEWVKRHLDDEKYTVIEEPERV